MQQDMQSSSPVQVHELDGDLLEGALRQQVTLDPRQRLVGVVIRLHTSHHTSSSLDVRGATDLAPSALLATTTTLRKAQATFRWEEQFFAEYRRHTGKEGGR